MKSLKSITSQAIYKISVFCMIFLLASCDKDEEGDKVVFVSIPKPVHSIATIGDDFPNLNTIFHRGDNDVLDSIKYDNKGYFMEYTGSNITTIRRFDGSIETVLTYYSNGLLKEIIPGGDDGQKYVRHYDVHGNLIKIEYLIKIKEPDGSYAYELKTALDDISVGPQGGTLKHKKYYQGEVIRTYLGEVECISRTNNLSGNIPYTVLHIYSNYLISFTNGFHYLISSLEFTNADDSDDFFGIYMDYTFNEEGNIATLERRPNTSAMTLLTIDYVE